MLGRGECERVRGFFSSFLDGCLGHVEEEVVRNHVGRCEDCRSELGSMEATRELLQWMPMDDVPRHFSLPEGWRGWTRDPLSIRSMGWLRVVAATVMVAFLVLVAADFSGVFHTPVEPLAAPQPSRASEEAVALEETPQGRILERSNLPSLDEARPPKPSDHQGIGGLSGGGDEATTEGKRGSMIPELQEPERSGHYLWLFPSEMAAFAVLVILGGIYLWAWRKRRKLTFSRGR